MSVLDPVDGIGLTMLTMRSINRVPAKDCQTGYRSFIIYYFSPTGAFYFTCEVLIYQYMLFITITSMLCEAKMKLGKHSQAGLADSK